VGAAQPTEITVGYNNDNPMCFTDFYALDSDLTLADYSTLNGYLRVRSLIPFTGSVCGEAIQVLVFACAGENMQYALPTDQLVVEGVVMEFNVDVDIQVQFQSGTVGAVSPSMMTVELVPSSGEYPVADILMGENPKSVRALMQKPSCMRLNDENFSSSLMLQFHTPFHGSQVKDGVPYVNIDATNYMHYFGTMYLAFAGGIRYKLLIDRGTLDPDTTLLQHTPLVCNYVACNGAFPIAELNPVLTDATLNYEVVVPYFSNEKFTAAYKFTDATPLDAFQWTFDHEAAFSAALYRSAAPDMRLTMFRCQNIFAFVANGLNHLPFDTWTFGDSLVARDKKATLNKAYSRAESRPMTIERYRARTGRKEFRQNKRKFMGRYSSGQERLAEGHVLVN